MSERQPKQNVLSANKLWEVLDRVIEMPENCKSITIRLRHGQLPTMTTVHIVRSATGEPTGQTQFKRYRIMED